LVWGQQGAIGPEDSQKKKKSYKRAKGTTKNEADASGRFNLEGDPRTLLGKPL